MKKRSKLPSKRSKHMFTKHAKKVHPKNHATSPMRGGIRL
jgi:hypothetical protein